MSSPCQSKALHSSIVSCLTAILNGHAHERKPAEDELKTLEVTEEYCLVLARITASSDSPLQYRQLASIVLKQYVETHWSKDLDEKFEEPEPPPNVKEEVRHILPLCLRDPQSKVRATVAYAISAIATLDWPEQWPGLFDELMFALSSGESDLVHGAMRVLSEFCHEISDTQLPQVVPIILPVLLKVIVQADLYSVRTRARAVRIFHTFANLVYSLCGRFPDAPNGLLFPILPDYLRTFVELLGNGNHGNDDPGLRREIIMTLCQLLQFFPKPLTQHVLTLVTPVWKILVDSVSSYVADVVNNQFPSEGVCDSDGEVKGQESTLFAIFEFISALSESSFSKRLLPPILPDLVYHLIGYMQITEEQMCVWNEDIARFVEDDENEFSYSVRLSALDLLLGMCETHTLGRVCCLAITTAMEKRLQENPLTSSPFSWKISEACLLSCSCALQAVSLGQGEFDCEGFVEQTILPILGGNFNPFLTGRCLWLASKMGPALKSTTISQMLELVASGLSSSQPHVLRILSAKAAFYFCSALKMSEHAQLLTPYLPHYLRWLSEMAGEYSEDVVSLIVDALQLVAQVDPMVTAQSARQLVPVATSLFLKYAHDPSVSMSVEELFQSLSMNPSCHGYLQTRFLPTAVEILTSSEDQMPLGLVPSVMDVLVHLVRGCGCEGGVLVTEVFPAVVQRLLNCDDSAILQNGGECVRAYVSSCMEQLASWHDSTGTSGIEYVVKVMLYLLDPGKPEFSASFVGKLIITFVKKAGSALMAHLELLLRSVLSKMQSTSSLSVMQSLLLVFAYLLHRELEAVLQFLSGVPDATGQSALSFVMREWLTKHPSFYGVFEPKLSSFSLCTILTHTLTTSDPRLTSLVVRDEEACPVEAVGVVTRSRRSQLPVRLTEVPVPVKIVKLVIGDIQNGLELEQPVTDESDVEEGETIEDTLDALLGLDPLQGGYDEAEMDPDLLDEPVLQLDLQDYLIGYLRELSVQNCWPPLLQQLSREELNTLSKVGINT